MPKKAKGLLLSSKKFSDYDIDSLMVLALEKAGFKTPTPIQLETIKRLRPEVLSGEKLTDHLIIAATGTGKSLSYLLPILNLLSFLKSQEDKELPIGRKDGTFVLIITPTRELSEQLCALITKLLSSLSSNPGFRWIVSGSLLSGASRDKEKARLRSGITILISTLGRLIDHLENTKSFVTKNLGLVVVEEADKFVETEGKAQLSKAFDLLHSRNPSEVREWKLLLVGATLPSNLTEIGNIKLHNRVVLKPGKKVDTKMEVAVPECISQKLLVIPAKRRLISLLSILKSTKGENAIVFSSTCDAVNFLFRLLKRLDLDAYGHAGKEEDGNWNRMFGANVYKLHSKMEPSRRSEVLGVFSKPCTLPVLLLTTHITAHGLDFPEVSTVIQYDPPCSPLDYVHTIGRTARGRVGGSSILCLMSHEEGPVTESMIEALGQWSPERMEFCSLIGIWKTDAAAAKEISGLLRSHIGPNSSEKKRSLEDRLLLVIEKIVSSNPVLQDLSKTAYSSNVKAYGAYDKTMRRRGMVVKALHLGHYGSCFGLSAARKRTNRVFEGRDE